MEFCGAGSLGDILAATGTTLAEFQIGAVCACVVKGLDYIHSEKLIHRVCCRRCCSYSAPHWVSRILTRGICRISNLATFCSRRTASRSSVRFPPSHLPFSITRSNTKLICVNSAISRFWSLCADQQHNVKETDRHWDALLDGAGSDPGMQLRWQS